MKALLINSALLVLLLFLLGCYTGEYLADALGWPIALILFGLVLLALSGYAIRLGQRMQDPPET